MRPGRSVTVDIAAESRLAALGEFGVIARSLTDTAVAVGLERQIPIDAAATADVVPGTAAMPGIDAAATAWAAPLDGNVLRLHTHAPLAHRPMREKRYCSLKSGS